MLKNFDDNTQIVLEVPKGDDDTVWHELDTVERFKGSNWLILSSKYEKVVVE
jgi:hypothetical protein